MSQVSSIEWTDVTWNPVHGCSKVSPGCAHCYAETLSLRYRETVKGWTPANAAENVILKPHKLREPLSNGKAWRGLGVAAAAAGKTDGQLVFVNSTSDLFHEEIPDEFIARVFAVMAAAERHTFQVLTKRPERMRALLGTLTFNAKIIEALPPEAMCPIELPLPNVWLGVSIENRRFVHRADLLRDTPAAVRFISAEPLLGPLVWDHAEMVVGENGVWQRHPQTGERALRRTWSDGYDGPDLDLTGIDWLIVGGESGPKHRPMQEKWARDLRDAARRSDSGTAFFLKQMGGARPGDRLDQLPEDLRIREFPRVTERSASR